MGSNAEAYERQLAEDERKSKANYGKPDSSIPMPNDIMERASAIEVDESLAETGLDKLQAPATAHSIATEFANAPNRLINKISQKVYFALDTLKGKELLKLTNLSRENTWEALADKDASAIIEQDPYIGEAVTAFMAFSSMQGEMQKGSGENEVAFSAEEIEKSKSTGWSDSKTMANYLAMHNLDQNKPDMAIKAAVLSDLINMQLAQVHALTISTGEKSLNPSDTTVSKPFPLHPTQQVKFDRVDREDGSSYFKLNINSTLEGVSDDEMKDTLPTFDPTLIFAFTVAETAWLGEELVRRGISVLSKEFIGKVAGRFAVEGAINGIQDIAADTLRDTGILGSMVGAATAGALVRMGHAGIKIYLRNLRASGSDLIQQFARMEVEGQSGAAFMIKQYSKAIVEGRWDTDVNMITADEVSTLADIILWRQHLEKSDPRKYIGTDYLPEALKSLKLQIETGTGPLGENIAKKSGLIPAKADVHRAELIAGKSELAATLAKEDTGNATGMLVDGKIVTNVKGTPTSKLTNTVSKNESSNIEKAIKQKIATGGDEVKPLSGGADYIADIDENGNIVVHSVYEGPKPELPSKQEFVGEGASYPTQMELGENMRPNTAVETKRTPVDVPAQANNTKRVKVHVEVDKNNKTSISVDDKNIVLKFAEGKVDSNSRRIYEGAKNYYDIAYRELAYTELGDYLFRSDVNSRYALPAIINVDNATRQLNTQNILIHNVHPDRSVSFGAPISINNKEIGNALKSWILTPKYVGDKISNLFTRMNVAKSFSNADKAFIMKAMKASVEGLDAKEMEAFDKAYRAGADLGVKLQWVDKGAYKGLAIPDGTIITSSEKVADAYMASMMLEDRLWQVLNTAEVERLKTSGVKKIALSSELVTPWSGKTEQFKQTADSFGNVYQEGDEVYKVLTEGEAPDGLLFVNARNKDSVTDIPYSFQVVDYRPGHGARIYRDPFLVRTFIKTPEGNWIETAKRTSDNLYDADQYITNNKPEVGKKVKAMIGDKEVEIEVADTFDIIHRTNEKGVVNIGRHKSDIGKFKDRDPRELLTMAKSMRESGVPDEVISYLTEIPAPELASKFRFAQTPGERLLNVRGEPADIKLAHEAFADYASSVVAFAYKRPVIDAIEKELLRNYGDIIDWSHGRGIFKVKEQAEVQGLESSKALDVTKRELRTGDIGQRRRATAQFLIDQLNEFQSSKTVLEQRADDFLETWAERLSYNLSESISKNPNSGKAKKWLHSTVNEWITNGSYLGRVLSSARTVTASGILGMWNVKSAVANLATVINASALIPNKYGLPTHGMSVLKAAEDTVGLIYSGQFANRLFGAEVPLNAMEARKWNLWQKSGLGAGLNFDGVSELAELRIGKKSFFNKGVDVSLALFKETEAVQKMFVMNAVDNVMLEEVKSGKHPTLKMKDINSDKYMMELIDRVSVLSYNMDDLNKARALRTAGGVGATVTQFNNILFKQAELMLGGTGKLNFAQTVSLWGAWTAAFGVAGIPFATDAITAYENIRADATNNPEIIGSTKEWLTEELAPRVAEMIISDKAGVYGDDVKTWLKRAASKGGVYASTDVDLLSSVAIGSAVTSLMANKEGIEMIPSANYFVKLTMSLGNWSDALYYTIKMDGDASDRLDFAVGAGKAALKETASTFSTSANNVIQAMQILEEGQFTTKKGDVLVINPTEREILLKGFGFNVGRVADARDWNQIETRRTESINDYITERANLYVNTWKNGNTEATERNLMRIITDTAETLQAIGYVVSYRYNEKGVPQKVDHLRAFLTKTVTETIGAHANGIDPEKQRMIVDTINKSLRQPE